MKQNSWLSLFGAVSFCALMLVSGRVARADSVVTNCANDSQLTTALASGGIITFNCGTAVITFGGQKTINVNTTIDGGGKITFNGANSTRLFFVNPGKALTLNNLVLTNGNSGADYGGAVYVNAGTLTLNKTTIQDSRTNGFAGGAIISSNGNVTLNDSLIQRNYSQYGAVNTTGTLTINRSVLQNNTATFGGGAVSASGTITIAASRFLNNKATDEFSNGGALLVVADGSVDLTNSTFTGNTANFHGGAIAAMDDVTMLLTDVTLSGNKAYDGGGIYNTGTIMTLVNLTLSGNSAYDGGGIFNNATATLHNVTLSGNSTVRFGGGISTYGTTLFLANVTLSDNSSLSDSGGIYRGGGTVTLKNTVIAKGATGRNCNVAFGGSFNLSDDNSCGFGAGDSVADLMLGPLSYNGSSIQTHLPKPGSPAIDSGTNTGAPSTDARGNARPQGFAVDVGAVEVCAVMPNKPALVTPGNNTKAKGLQVALNWDDTSCADKYKINIKDAATDIKVQGGKSATSNFKTTTLVKGKSYKWFVQACNTIGCTKSDTWKFTVK